MHRPSLFFFRALLRYGCRRLVDASVIGPLSLLPLLSSLRYPCFEAPRPSQRWLRLQSSARALPSPSAAPALCFRRFSPVRGRRYASLGPFLRPVSPISSNLAAATLLPPAGGFRLFQVRFIGLGGHRDTGVSRLSRRDRLGVVHGRSLMGGSVT